MHILYGKKKLTAMIVWISMRIVDLPTVRKPTFGDRRRSYDVTLSKTSSFTNVPICLTVYKRYNVKPNLNATTEQETNKKKKKIYKYWRAPYFAELFVKIGRLPIFQVIMSASESENKKNRKTKKLVFFIFFFPLKI